MERATLTVRSMEVSYKDGQYVPSVTANSIGVFTAAVSLTAIDLKTVQALLINDGTNMMVYTNMVTSGMWTKAF